MPVDVKNKPEEDAGIDPEWFRRESDPLEDAYNAPSATDDDLPPGHPSRSDGGVVTSGTDGVTGPEPTKGDLSENAELDNFFRQEKEAKEQADRTAKSKAAGFFRSKRGKWITGGVAATGVTGVAFFSFLLPLKVMSFTENLEKTFFSSSEQATDQLTNRLFANYLISKVIPGLSGTCDRTSVNRSCALHSDGNGPVSTLYNAWRDQNLEGKMADKYGLEVRRENGNYYMRKGNQTLWTGTEKDRQSGNKKLFDDKLYAAMDRKEVRREFLKAIEGETFYKRVMLRYKFGRLMERKYNVVRCVIACDYRNDRAERKELRKIKFKAWLIQRTIGPMNEAYALAFECATASFDCTSNDSTTTGEDGDRRTQYQADLQSRTQSVVGSGRMTREEFARIQGNANDIRANGLQHFIFKKLVGETMTKVLGQALPGIGMVDTLSRIVVGLQNAGPAIKSINYAMKSQAFVSIGMMYLTNRDEIKTGKVNAEEVGYVADSLGDSFGTDQGGGGIESSPYIHDIMGSRGVSTASLFPKAEAAPIYKCNDGSTIANGLCPEMTVTALTTGANVLQDVSDIFNSIPGLGPLAQGWLSTGGKAFDAISNILGPLAGTIIPDDVQKLGAKMAEPVGKWFISKLFVNPLGDSPSGGRMGEGAAVGFNMMANDHAHYNLGAGKISDQQAREIMYNRAVEDNQEFMQKSFFARMFDTSDSHSTVSQLAMATPSGVTSTARTLSSSLLNPFAMVSSLIPTSRKVSAAPIKNLDLAGVTQYGYALDDPIFQSRDYDKWWQDHNCDDPETLNAWAESAHISSDNGSSVNDTSNPCKLVQNVSTSLCGYAHDECLTPEEIGDQVSSGDGGGFGLRAATFNILHSSGDTAARLRRSVDTLLHPPPPGEGKPVDVVGLQEVRQDQLTMLKSGEFGSQYGMFPDSVKHPDYEPNIIAWKKGKYEVIKQDFINAHYFHNAPEQMPVLKLKDTATGESFYFASIHNPRSGNGRGENASVRDDNARLFNEYFANIKRNEPDVAIILVGDFNSGYQAADKLDDVPVGRRSFCILTNGIFWDSWHASKHVDDKCPTKSTVNFIDHIFVDRGTKVSTFFTAERGETKNGSDHPTVFADISVGESQSDGGGSNGWSWPLRDHVNNGPCYGVDTPDGKHAGMDMNSSTLDNPIYAMHSGKVVRKGYDADGAGNYITILADTQFNDKPVYYSYEHMEGGTVRIDVGDKISGGDLVGIAGHTGNVSLGSSLAHLHIVMATTNSLGAYGNLGTTFNPMDVLKSAGPAPGGYQCTQ